MGENAVARERAGSVAQAEFQGQLSEHHKRRMARIEQEEGSIGKHLEVCLRARASWLAGSRTEAESYSLCLLA